MHVRPPENPIEDKYIHRLDRRIPICQREVEMATIRLAMHLREKARLRFLLRRAKLAEVHP